MRWKLRASWDADGDPDRPFYFAVLVRPDRTRFLPPTYKLTGNLVY